MAMPQPAEIALLPDAGPLITLAYANALDVLHRPGWTVQVVDMVLHEVTRNQTPTSERIAQWVQDRQVVVVNTAMGQRYVQELTTSPVPPRRANLGELAIQEAMNGFALERPAKAAVFLFEDPKIAQTGFVLPALCRKVSTRAFLWLLEQQGWIASAAQIERDAVAAGRAFSNLRFPL
jgi:hypothetical protein